MNATSNTTCGRSLAGRARTTRSPTSSTAHSATPTGFHDGGTEWTGSWRCAAGVVADLRGRGEDYLDFYCSPSGAEGTISERVGAVMAGLGWHATAHGAPLRLIDFATGTSMVFVDGDWVDAGDYDG